MDLFIVGVKKMSVLAFSFTHDSDLDLALSYSSHLFQPHHVILLNCIDDQHVVLLDDILS